LNSCLKNRKIKPISETEIKERFNKKLIPKDPHWLKYAYSKNLSNEFKFLICERLGFLGADGWIILRELIEDYGYEDEIIYGIGLCHQIEAKDYLIDLLNSSKNFSLPILKALNCWGAFIPNSQLKLIIKNKSADIRLAGLDLVNFKSYLLDDHELIEILNIVLSDFREEIIIKCINILQKRNSDKIIDLISNLVISQSKKSSLSAIRALGSIGTKRSSYQLKKLLNKINDKELVEFIKKQISFQEIFN
tara:strand:+ start:367 stop:1113 length:747 start_codon:yes stop_codon:yes gene_type:complete